MNKKINFIIFNKMAYNILWMIKTTFKMILTKRKNSIKLLLDYKT